MPSLTDALAALAPSVGVGLVFWFAMRAIVRADARERAAIAAMERAAEEKRAI
jgi:hypothetical protein